MKPNPIFKSILILFMLFSSIVGFSQETNDDENDMPTNKKGFHFGLYVGSYFANKYTASLYDGYGFDIDGNRNNFENSFMYQKIWLQYGGYGYTGQPDQIATALNIDYHTWTFDESDMPTNMRYAPAFSVGLQGRYTTDEKNAILINVNAAKLTINGNFTIITPQLPNSTQINDRIKTFAIKGGEQRLMVQFGYQRILGDNENCNFLVEGGLNMTLTKFDKNEVMINGLHIDLLSYYNTTLYATGAPIRRPVGTGFGAFGGLGLNLTMNPKWTIQLLYNPSYEGINIGINPRLKMQNAAGLRAYYML